MAEKRKSSAGFFEPSPPPKVYKSLFSPPEGPPISLQDFFSQQRERQNINPSPTPNCFGGFEQPTQNNKPPTELANKLSSHPLGPFTINFSPSFCFFGDEHTQNNNNNNNNNKSSSPEGPPSLTINLSPSFCFFGGEQTQNKPPSPDDQHGKQTNSPFVVNTNTNTNTSPSTIFGFSEGKQTNSPFMVNSSPSTTCGFFGEEQRQNKPSGFNPFLSPLNKPPSTESSSPFVPSTTFGFPEGKQTNSPFVGNTSPAGFFDFPSEHRENNNKPPSGFFGFGSPFSPRQNKPEQERQEAQYKSFDARMKLLEPLRKLGESIVKQTDFALSLAKHVISTTEAKDTNFVFSPLSMHVVLSMVAAGSGGPTRAQFLDYLNSSSVEDLNSLSSRVEALLFHDGGPIGGPHLSFANGVWIDKSLTLKPAFRETVDKDYKAAASDQADFMKRADEVRQEVNSWAEKKTNGLIKDLLPPDSVDSSTRLILANALYFKGVWENKFDKSLTKENDFFLLNGTNYVRVPFMTSREDQYIRAFVGFKVLRLQYEQGHDSRRFSMLIYLPDARDGLPALLEKFGSDPGFIQNHLPGSVRVREFRVPKFKIGFGFEATDVLKGHGLVLPFSRGGLTEMVENDGGKGLKITSFHHKTCIEVDEEGTEAAAASGCVIGVQMCMSPKPELDFVADHPFLFVVREDVSGGVLFVGQLLNPASAA